jgi:hypothetical protein
MEKVIISPALTLNDWRIVMNQEQLDQSVRVNEKVRSLVEGRRNWISVLSSAQKAKASDNTTNHTLIEIWPAEGSKVKLNMHGDEHFAPIREIMCKYVELKIAGIDEELLEATAQLIGNLTHYSKEK